jgi:large subunit ribosomal protein L21
MYAVIETGGKQYRVEVGTQLEVELLDAKAGDTVTIDRVLLVADGDTAAIGHPVVTEASVSAEVLRQERGEKVISFKYRPKARRRVKKGHRQELLVLRIADIVLNGKSAAAAVRKAESDAKSERQRLEEAARRQAAEDAALAAKLAAAKAPKTDKADAKGSAAPAKPAGSKPAGSKPAGSKPAARKTAAKADASSAIAPKTAAKAAKPAAKAAAPKPAAKADAAAKPAPKKPRATKKDE